jgi:DNA-binding LytR/AlgR family response regulator
VDDKMAFSFLILDDELDARDKLKKLILSMAIDSKILMASSYEQALEFSKSTDIDVYLVDIDLQEKYNGFDFIEEIRKSRPRSQIVIISSRKEKGYRLKAYDDLDVLRYITKPYKNEKVIHDLQIATEYALAFDSSKVTFKRQDFMKTYKARDILCIKRVPGDKKKIIVTAFEGANKISEEEFSIKRSLLEVPAMFEHENAIIRCHQSWLVNPNKISGFDLASEKLILPFDIRIPVGERYRDEIAPFI